MDKLGPYELNTIITGDARELAKAIPDESVDLVFTDPIYSNIDDYRWLAETAARVLKPDSACLVWFDEPNFDAIYRSMTPILSFAAFMHWQRYGHLAPSRSGITVISPCLWLEVGKSKTYKRIANWCGVPNGLGVSNFHWSKPMILLRKWVDAFTLDGSTVFDPFTGGGTVPAVCKMLGRNYLAFEIDPATADMARERVANTQPPLFVDGPQQTEMEL
jgi:hypothetical protein